MRRVALAPIRAYQRWISGSLGSNCIYHPTCSEFAHGAIGRHGVIRGSWMAVRRIARCHPFATGGYDPVP